MRSALLRRLNVRTTFTLPLFVAACSSAPLAAHTAKATAEALTANATLVPDAVAWFRAEGNANDSIGSAGGTMAGARYGTGKVGQAFSFDGTSSRYVQLPQIPAFATNQLTLSAWINATSSPGNQTWIAGQNGRTQIIVTDSNHVAINFVGSDNQFHVVADPTPLSLGTWAHYTATIALSNEGFTTATLYRDGEQTTSQTFHFGVADDNGCGAWIGGVYEGGPCSYAGQFFNGLIDEVQVFNVPLTAPQVASLYATSTLRLNALLFNSNSGKCVYVPSAFPSDYTPIIQFDCGGGSNSRLNLVPARPGYYQIVSPMTGLCLDAGPTTDDANLYERYCNGGAEQLFAVNAMEGNPFDGYNAKGMYFVSKNSGKCLGISPSAIAYGNPAIQQMTCNASASQWFSPADFIGGAITGAKTTLAVGEVLTTGQYLVAPQRNAYLILQGDGNVCEYNGSDPSNTLGGALWCSGQTAQGGQFFLQMQSDGNLCEYEGTGPSNNLGGVWCSGSNVSPGAGWSGWAALEADGELAIYDDGPWLMPRWTNNVGPLSGGTNAPWVPTDVPVTFAAPYAGPTSTTQCQAQTFIVPPNANGVMITATGGTGASGGAGVQGGAGSGGAAATVQAVFAVSPGTKLYVMPASNGFASNGGWGGGGMGARGWGKNSAGGASYVSTSAPVPQDHSCFVSPMNTLIIAGGGGGGGTAFFGRGGDGGNAGLLSKPGANGGAGTGLNAGGSGHGGGVLNTGNYLVGGNTGPNSGAGGAGRFGGVGGGDTSNGAFQGGGGGGGGGSSWVSPWAFNPQSWQDSSQAPSVIIVPMVASM